jgi:predicted nuclease of predicted toxin-antitoxin system
MLSTQNLPQRMIELCGTFAKDHGLIIVSKDSDFRQLS